MPNYYTPNSLSKAAPSNIGGFNRIGDLTNEGLLGVDAGTIAHNATQQRAKYLQQMSQQDNPALRESFGGLYNYINGASNNLQGLSNQNISNVDTQSQQGLKNLLDQHARTNAGRGLIGTRQNLREQGDIYGEMASKYNQGLLAERNAAPGRAVTLANALGGVQQAEDYRPRYIMDQLAGLGNDSVRNFAATQFQPGPEDPSFLQQIAPVLGTAAGAYFGGPLGAMVGGQLGTMAGGGGSNQQQSGITQAAQIAALASQYGGKNAAPAGAGVDRNYGDLGQSTQRPYSSMQYLDTNDPNAYYNPNYNVQFKGYR